MTVSTAISWPAAATPPRAPLRAGIARVVFEHAVGRVPVRVTYPDGRVLGAGSPASPELEVVRPAAFFARLGRDAKIGFGEAYMAGDWRAGSGTDLADLLASFASQLTTLIPPALQRLRVFVDRPVPHDHENNLDGARSNIAAHYDLSNDLFAAFLDPTMTYSSAWFGDSEPMETATRLEEAQLRKIDGILDLAGVRSGTRVLEIGSGWGSLAIRAAQRGARVTTVTLSREQMRLARERVEAAGLSGLVEVRVQDYREVEGLYDAIVSVEMIEAVGEAYWPAYFAVLDRLLAPGGRAAIQAITMDHKRFLATRRSFMAMPSFFRNSVLNAAGPFNITKPQFQQNQFGGTFGGPIKKNRAFFFLSYEGRRIKQGIPSPVFQVPDQAQRGGRLQRRRSVPRRDHRSVRGGHSECAPRLFRCNRRAGRNDAGRRRALQ